jgi:hypothetical protein
MFTKDSIEMDSAIDGGDTVLREDSHSCATVFVMFQQRAAHRVYFGEISCDGRMGWSEPLEVVIQMWKIDQRQGRIEAFVDSDRCVGDPFAGFN